MKPRPRPILIASATVLQLGFLVSAVPLDALFSPRARVVRFKAELYDPYHPMKGRYVALNIDAEEIPVDRVQSVAALEENERYRIRGSSFYCRFSEAPAGGVSGIEDLTERKTPGSEFYIAGCAASYREGDDGEGRIRVQIPADRYYIQEDLAADAERLLGEKEAFVALRVAPSGRFVVNGIEVDGVSLERAVAAARKARP